MEKQIILDLGDGDFYKGFSQTTIKIQRNVISNRSKNSSISCHLANTPELPELYKQWQKIYGTLVMPKQSRGRIHKESAGAINVAEYIKACDQALSKLQGSLDQWLSSTKEQLEQVLTLDSQDEIRIIVQTHRIRSEATKDILHRLPWHLWNLFPEGYLTESAISFIDSEQIPPKTSPKLDEIPALKRVKVLCVLGENRNQIDVEADRRLFRKISGAYCVFLRQPELSELESYLNERWDILFFAGHSTTQNHEDRPTGFLQINSKQSLNIQEIRKTLKQAIKKGMKLAIFNSCDGLGLAHQIADLDITQIIVWREPVPDRVAQEFLNSFIQFFTEGASLYRAVQKARLALQTYGQKWPKVSWLPMIYQNLAKEPITWQKLRRYPELGEGLEQNRLKAKTPRNLLLKKVEEAWVTGVLNNSIHLEIMLELGLEERLDAVSKPPLQEHQNDDRAARALPAGTRAIDIYGELQNKRTLLILGEPGSGKTIALLEIAQELIQDARLDSALPIPVVLNLSSWAGKRQTQPLDKWLVEELNRIYQFSRHQCQVWIKNQQLLLLLDGLDEIKVSEKRETCVRAINQFLRNYEKTQMVVCSRIKVYEDLSERLQFNRAVIYKPLTTEQINLYLGDAKNQLSGVRDMLPNAPILRSLIENPLILNIVAVAYKGKSTQELTDMYLLKEPQLEESQREKCRQHLFDEYIDKRFKQKTYESEQENSSTSNFNLLSFSPNNFQYPEEKSRQWLVWLAQKMLQQSQAVFLIEQIQPNWLSSRIQTWIHLIGVRVILGLVIGLIGVLHFGTQVTDELEVQISLAIPSVTAAIISSLSSLILSEFLPRNSPSQRKPIYSLITVAILSGLLYVLIAAPWVHEIVASKPEWQGSYFGKDPWKHIIYPLLIDGFSLGIFLSLQSQEIGLIDTVQNSWKKAQQYSLIGLLGGSLYVLARLTFSDRYNFNLLNPRDFDLQTFDYHDILIELLIFSLLPGLIGLFDKGENLEQTVAPNQGVWRSAKNAFRFFAIFFPIGILCSLNYIKGGLHEAISIGLAVGLLAGLVGGKGPTFAGVVLIQHFVLRLLLWCQNYIPWNYARFLNYAEKHVFLRKVGGGYIFIHRTLMEHFAQRAPLKIESDSKNNV